MINNLIFKNITHLIWRIQDGGLTKVCFRIGLVLIDTNLIMAPIQDGVC
jgi:hypothetical protein